MIKLSELFITVTLTEGEVSGELLDAEFGSWPRKFTTCDFGRSTPDRSTSSAHISVSGSSLRSRTGTDRGPACLTGVTHPCLARAFCPLSQMLKLDESSPEMKKHGSDFHSTRCETFPPFIDICLLSHLLVLSLSSCIILSFDCSSVKVLLALMTPQHSHSVCS